MSFFHFESFWYLCGIAEDAYIRKNPIKGYEFDLDSASLGWLQHVQPILMELIEKEVRIRPHTNRPHFRLRFFHKDLVTELWEIKEHPEIVRRINPSSQKQYIAGFFDAEGSATITGTNQPMLSMYSTRLDKITILTDLLDNFYIHSGVYLPEGRNVYQLYITGRDTIREFAMTIPIRHPEKREKIRLYNL